MKNILSFKKFIFEQETTTDPSNTSPETERQTKSRIAKSLVKSLFGDFGDIGASIDSEIEITKEVKDSLPYKGCGATEPYLLKKTEIPLSGFKIILNYLQDKGLGDYKRAIKELEEKRALIIGFRNKIDIKKETSNQDRFIDGLYFIPQNSNPTDKFSPYQITTVPSLAYYGKKPLNPNGTGIKLPGDTLYYLKESKLGDVSYKMMVEGEKVKVGRYAIGITKFDTYKPTDQSTENCGMQIHRSSTKGRGICVGPWSGGCQVFADGEEWKDFISKSEKQTSNNNKFYYALVELDSIPADILSRALKGEEQEAIASAKTSTINKDQSGKKVTKQAKEEV